MEKVLGLGGIFLKANDPKALAAWYRDHLGLEINDYGGMFVSSIPFQANEPGQQVWSIFPAQSSYFPGAVMVNYRVADLDAMVAQLRAAGAALDPKIDDSDYGRFAWVTDPEGNRIELWQPPANPPVDSAAG